MLIFLYLNLDFLLRPAKTSRIFKRVLYYLSCLNFSSSSSRNSKSLYSTTYPSCLKWMLLYIHRNDKTSPTQTSFKVKQSENMTRPVNTSNYFSQNIINQLHLNRPTRLFDNCICTALLQTPQNRSHTYCLAEKKLQNQYVHYVQQPNLRKKKSNGI